MRNCVLFSLSLLALSCNVPVLSPEERVSIDSLGPVSTRQEQTASKLEALTTKVESNIQAGGDVNTRQEQTLAKVEGQIKVLTTMSAEFKTSIDASQKAGGDAPRQSGFLNIMLNHGGTYASAGLAVVLGYFGYKLRTTSRDRKEKDKAGQAIVQGVEDGTEKLATVLATLQGVTEARAKSLARVVKRSVQDKADELRASPVVRDWVESNGNTKKT